MGHHTLCRGELARVWAAVLDVVAQLVEHARAVGLQPALDEEVEQAHRSSQFERGKRPHQAT
jgi:hypothetical protein